MDCQTFLQKVLPKLHRRWAGYRKVKSQVCKRIKRRMQTLQLTDFADYWEYLQVNMQEWDQLDACCDITISRFYRDHQVFDLLKDKILPNAIEELGPGEDYNIWSAGCCSGEEPFTLSLIMAISHPQVNAQILATDLDEELLQRAEKGCYRSSSLRELPQDWKPAAFDLQNELYCLKGKYKQAVTFMKQDIRRTIPQGPFHLVLCRNLVATYFDDHWQMKLFAQIRESMHAHGYLILGKHERLPAALRGFKTVHEHFRIYQKS